MKALKQAFSEAGLGAKVRQSDYRNFRTILSKSTRDSLVGDAVKIASSGFAPGCGLNYHLRKKREICSVPNLPAILVLRKIASNIEAASGKKPADRNRLIQVLVGMLSEEVEHRVYRLDIRRFFETIDIASVLERVSSLGTTQETQQLLRVVLHEHTASGRTGIPTGLAVSSPIAEAMMIDFDYFMRSHPSVTFAARFVDDIVIVTSAGEHSGNFCASLDRLLPSGTTFNTSKTKIVDISKKSASSYQSQAFEYLGYRFQIHDVVRTPKEIDRLVTVDMSDNTLCRYRSKLCKAFRTFARDGCFDDLYNRINYLRSNYRLYDPRVGRKRLAGIYHNHPFLTAECGSSLHRLDEILLDLVQEPSNMRASAGVGLTTKQKRKLTQKTFVSGHQERLYSSFSIKTLARIKRCWFDG